MSGVAYYLQLDAKACGSIILRLAWVQKSAGEGLGAPPLNDKPGPVDPGAGTLAQSVIAFKHLA